MTFRRRNYPEVLDNLLTTLVGGVAAESHPFPPPGDGSPPAHALEEPPVREVVSVYGTRNGTPHLFRAGNDYQLEGDKQTLSWLTDTRVPDAGTLVHINYLREDDAPLVSDLQVGSVLRTLTESTALEMARLYAQLEAVYKAGFIDTATGSALDKVVALLDVQRIKGTRPSVKMKFTRANGVRGAISIPAGTRVLDEQVKFEYETIESVTMTENQNTISVLARDLEPANEPVPADTLTVLAVPVAGIRTVTNPGPAARASADETDQELRTRAKNFLHGSERATFGALRQVLTRHQIAGDIEETAPGTVTVTPHGDDLTPEQLLQLQKALDETRPAGVRVILDAPLTPVAVNVQLRLSTAEKTVEADLRAAHAAVRDAIRGYFDELPTRENASLNQIVGRALAVPNVIDIQIESATTVEGTLPTERLDRAAGIIDLSGLPTILGELTVADANLPTVLDVVISFPPSADVPDQTTQESALAAALAYLNTLAETAFDPSDALEAGKRELSLGKFALLLPLPGRSTQTLADFDAAPDPTLLPTTADLTPYRLSVFLTQASGLATALIDDAGRYGITTSERIALNEVTIAVEDS